MSDQKQCPDEKCRAYHGHTYQCSLASPEYKSEQLLRYHESLMREYGRVKRLTDLVQFWQGKFEILRRENNKLRKKLKATAPGGEVEDEVA